MAECGQIDIQEFVYGCIAARGHADGWTDEQMVARQVVKLGEKLAEAAVSLRPARLGSWMHDWRRSMARHGILSYEVFEVRDAWNGAGVQDAEALKGELADMMVVILTAAAALNRVTGGEFDVIQAAMEKALEDVDRGVRSPTP